MVKKDVSKKIISAGIIIQTDNGRLDEQAEKAKSIVGSGINIMVISALTDGVEEIIEHILQKNPDIILGVSDVTTKKKCESIVSAGADFIISPGLDIDIALQCLENEVLIIPNCVTPTEMMAAYKLGLKILAFYPPASYGGIATIEAVSKSLKDVKWLPLGLNNLSEFDEFSSKNFIAAVGYNLICENQKDILKVEKICREAIDRILGFEMFHVGINSPNSEGALTIAKNLNHAFGFKVEEGPGAYYASKNLIKVTDNLIDPTGEIATSIPGAFYVTTDFEIMKKNYLGTNGHLAIATNSVERAIVHLENKGYTINMSTAYRRGDRYFTVYLNDDNEFGGFAIHLFQK